YAWIMVVVFCVGVPGGCFLLLWRQRDKINVSEETRKKDKSLDSIRSLFENYKPEHWYWEPVEMTRRIFMTGFLVVLARGSFAQIVVCLGVSMVALTLLITRSPFLRGNDNLVAEAMYTQIIITLLLCVLVKSSAASAEELRATFEATAAAKAAEADALRAETDELKTNVAARVQTLRVSVAAETGKLLAKVASAEERAERAEGEVSVLRQRVRDVA
ncbi:hypothetical protein TeGR_g11125, partial [Tetraparma gracilis]